GIERESSDSFTSSVFISGFRRRSQFEGIERRLSPILLESGMRTDTGAWVLTRHGQASGHATCG
ncbi:MAG: hypothetical protein ACTSUU_06440, partial [Candidatus Thorarchaeota archaeon]